jgi:hypothetical protein
MFFEYAKAQIRKHVFDLPIARLIMQRENNDNYTIYVIFR